MQQKSWNGTSPCEPPSCNPESCGKELVETSTSKNVDGKAVNDENIDESKLICSFKNCLTRKELIKPFFTENISAIEKLEKRYAEEGWKISSQNIVVLILFLNMFKYKYFNPSQAPTPQADLERHFHAFLDKMVSVCAKDSHSCYKKLTDFVSFCDLKNVLSPQVIAQAQQTITDSFKNVSNVHAPQHMSSTTSSISSTSSFGVAAAFTAVSAPCMPPVPKTVSSHQEPSTSAATDGFLSSSHSSLDAELSECENSTPKDSSDTQFQPPWMSDGYKSGVGRSKRFASQGKIPSFLEMSGYDFGNSKTPRSSVSASGSGSSSSCRMRSKLGTLSYNNSSLDNILTSRTVEPSPVLPQSSSGTCYSLGAGSNLVTPTFLGARSSHKVSLSVGSKPYSDQLRYVDEIAYNKALKKVARDFSKAKCSIEGKSPPVADGKSCSTIGFKRAWDEFIERNDKKKHKA